MSSILGDLSKESFLEQYWQQKPLLVRGAYPGFESPITADELAGLACEEDVESRIVIESGSEGAWELRTGPFDDATFADLPSTGWTLLVQAVDLWVPTVAELLAEFDFLPPWRVDDIMVSFAPVDGSVGPHFDDYDVFLLQVEGERRWQIGQDCDAQTRCLPDTPLRILQDFELREEHLLAPGDLLYLPPGTAHWGVAMDDCMTWSVGFRSPTLAEMLGDLATELLARNDDRHYRDPPLRPAMADDTIDPAFVSRLQHMLQGVVDDRELLEDWFARYMTTPKYPDLLADTGEVRRARTRHHRYLNGDIEQ